jgi:hypothetical protein
MTARDGIQRLKAASPFQIAIMNHVKGFGALNLDIHDTRTDTFACTGQTSADTETGWELISTANFGVGSAQRSDPAEVQQRWVRHRLGLGYRSVAYGAADFHYFHDNGEPRDAGKTNLEDLGKVATVVYADSLSLNDIGRALKNGQTFATSGPGIAVWACRTSDAGACVSNHAWMGEYLRTEAGDELKVIVGYSSGGHAIVRLHRGTPGFAALGAPPDIAQNESVVLDVVVPPGEGSLDFSDVIAAGEIPISQMRYYRASIFELPGPPGGTDVDTRELPQGFTTPVWLKIGTVVPGTAAELFNANFNKNKCLSAIGTSGDPPRPVGIQTACKNLNLPASDDPSAQPMRLTRQPIVCDAESCAGCCAADGSCHHDGDTPAFCGRGGQACETCSRLTAGPACLQDGAERHCGCTTDAACAQSRNGLICGDNDQCGCVSNADCSNGKTCRCNQRGGCSKVRPGRCARAF